MAQTPQNGNKLETAKVGPLLLSLAAPMILAEIITLLYNMVDRIYIGHMENSSYAMAGIGLCAPLVMIISAFARLFGQGGAPLSAIAMGQKNNDEAEQILSMSFSCMTGTAVVLTVVFLLLAEPMLRLFGASDNTLPCAMDYLVIYSLGTVFVTISVGMISFINTQGFANTGMATMAAGAIINIILDPIFIFVLDMGVRGAALATVLSQGVSCVWILLFLFGKRTYLRVRLKYLVPQWRVLRRILALGVTPFFQSTTEGLVNICFNNQLYIYGGDLAVSSLTIIMSLYQIVQMPMQGIALGAQPIISYNYGAEHYDRVRSSLRLSLVVSTLYSLVGTLLMMLFPTLFAQLFTKDGELLQLTAKLLPIYIAGGLVCGIFSTYQAAYNALGKGFYAFAFAFVRKIILLIPLLYIFPAVLPWGAAAVMLAEPVSDSLVSVANGIYFQFFARKKLGAGATPPAK